MKNAIANSRVARRPEYAATEDVLTPERATPVPGESKDDPILCYWDLGPEELPQFHRIVRDHERATTADGDDGRRAAAADNDGAPGPGLRTSTLAPIALVPPGRAGQQPDRPTVHRRRWWRQAAYSAALAIAAAAVVTTVELDRTPAVQPADAHALLTVRALALLEGRAAAMEWPAGTSDLELLSPPLDEPDAKPASPVAVPAERVTEAGERAAPVETTHDSSRPSTEESAPPGHASQAARPGAKPTTPARHRAMPSGDPGGEDQPPDELDVAWQEEQRATVPSTDAQTPATPLQPNRWAGRRRLDGSPRPR